MRKHQKINLIPASHKPPPPVSVDQLIGVSFILVVLGCALHFYSDYTTVNRLTIESTQAMAQQADIRRKIAEATNSIAASAIIDEQEGLIRKVVSSKPAWADAFKELSLVVPRETWLSQLQLVNTSGKITVSIKGETSSQANMADFLASLERSEFFSNILMISSKLSEQTNPPLYSFIFAAPDLAQKTKEATR